MADMFVPVNGIIRRVSGVYVPVNGVIRKVSKIPVPVNGTVREGYVAFDPTLPNQDFGITNTDYTAVADTYLTKEIVIEANDNGYTKLVFTLSVDFTPVTETGDSVSVGLGRNTDNWYTWLTPIVSALPIRHTISTNASYVYVNEYVNESYPSDATVTFTINVSELLKYDRFKWFYDGDNTGYVTSGRAYVTNMHFEK